MSETLIETKPEEVKVEEPKKKKPVSEAQKRAIMKYREKNKNTVKVYDKEYHKRWYQANKERLNELRKSRDTKKKAIKMKERERFDKLAEMISKVTTLTEKQEIIAKYLSEEVKDGTNGFEVVKD